MTTVTWVLDSNGNYEISSAEHLKQLMHQGSLYTDAGTPPSSYWGTIFSYTNYIQTAHIDLLSDSTDIIPIGNSSTPFYGNYDGSEYSISNYYYLDPNFSTSNNCVDYVGLFGSARSNYLKNIRLDGVWKIEGFDSRVGFLIGDYRFYGSNSGIIDNIEGNFSVGTLIDTNNANSNMYVGSLFGFLSLGLEMTSVTVKGTVNLLQDKNSTYASGGIVGRLGIRTDNGSVSMIRNIATFPSGIGGVLIGGIVGNLFYGPNQDISITNLLNCMIGDIFASNLGAGQKVGGIIGGMNVTETSTASVRNLVNSMSGNIYANGSNASMGGIAGTFGGFGPIPSERFLNYMTGDIYITGNTSTLISGLIGYMFLYSASNEDTGTVTNCINAMNGNVQGDALFTGFSTNSPTPTNTVSNTNFGLTFTSNIYNTGTPTGLLTSTEFTDLPYFDMIDTDYYGNSYDFEFVYGNLSGNASYPDYTHLILHRRNIDTPYEVNYGLDETNTTVYLTYVNVNTQNVYPPSGLTGVTTVVGVTIFIPLAFIIQERVINLNVSITEVTGSTGYRLTIEGPTGGEVTKVNNNLELSHNLVGLDPETQYTVRLYVNTGSGYTLTESIVITTLANIASNYDLTDFEENGVVNISSLKENSNIGNVLDDLFNTGDAVITPLPSNPNIQSVFVKRGETLSIKEVESTLLPFSETSGSGQTLSVLLSDDSTTVPITYDETSDSVTVSSVTYTNGSSFILDGKKVTVHGY